MLLDSQQANESFSTKTKITYYFRLGLLFPIDNGGLISVWHGLSVVKKLVNSKPNILCNLPEQDGGNISARVERYCCTAPVWMAKLFVRTFLSDFMKTKTLKNDNDLSGFEDWDFCHD